MVWVGMGCRLLWPSSSLGQRHLKSLHGSFSNTASVWQVWKSLHMSIPEATRGEEECGSVFPYLYDILIESGAPPVACQSQPVGEAASVPVIPRVLNWIGQTINLKQLAGDDLH